MTSQDKKLMIIENYIDWFTSNETERKNLKENAVLYVDEDHVEELEDDFEVFVAWGESNERHYHTDDLLGSMDFSNCSKYVFETKGEKDAFIKGLDCCNGWMGFAIMIKEDYLRLEELQQPTTED